MSEWPCKTPIAPDLPPRLVGVLYQLVRDHLPPGTLEDILTQHEGTSEHTIYTNPHLELMARADATFLARKPDLDEAHGEDTLIVEVALHQDASEEAKERARRALDRIARALDGQPQSEDGVITDPETGIIIDPDAGSKFDDPENIARWVQPGTSLTAPREALVPISGEYQGRIGRLLEEAKYDTIWITVADSGVMRFTQGDVNKIAEFLGLEVSLADTDPQMTERPTGWMAGD